MVDQFDIGVVKKHKDANISCIPNKVELHYRDHDWSIKILRSEKTKTTHFFYFWPMGGTTVRRLGLVPAEALSIQRRRRTLEESLLACRRHRVFNASQETDIDHHHVAVAFNGVKDTQKSTVHRMVHRPYEYLVTGYLTFAPLSLSIEPTNFSTPYGHKKRACLHLNEPSLLNCCFYFWRWSFRASQDGHIKSEVSSGGGEIVFQCSLARVNDYKSDLYGNLKTFLLEGDDWIVSIKRRSPGVERRYTRHWHGV